MGINSAYLVDADGKKIYPKTVTPSVLHNNGQTLDSYLSSLEGKIDSLPMTQVTKQFPVSNDIVIPQTIDIHIGTIPSTLSMVLGANAIMGITIEGVLSALFSISTTPATYNDTSLPDSVVNSQRRVSVNVLNCTFTPDSTITPIGITPTAIVVEAPNVNDYTTIGNSAYYIADVYLRVTLDHENLRPNIITSLISMDNGVLSLVEPSVKGSPSPYATVCDLVDTRNKKLQLDIPIATSAINGILHPDNETVFVDSTGRLFTKDFDSTYTYTRTLDLTSPSTEATGFENTVSSEVVDISSTYGEWKAFNGYYSNCDNIPIWQYTEVNGYVDDAGEFVETATMGEPSFSRTGTNGDVYIRFNSHYVKYDITPTTYSVSLSSSRRVGYNPCPASIRPDGSIRPYVYIAKYPCSILNNVPMSISGRVYDVTQAASNNVNSYTGMLATMVNKGTQYTGFTSKDWMFLRDLMFVEFGNTSMFDDVLFGFNNNQLSATCSVAGTNVTTITIATANAAGFYKGMNIYIDPDFTTHYTITDIEVSGNNTILTTNEPLTTSTSTVIKSAFPRTGHTDYINDYNGSKMYGTGGITSCYFAGDPLVYTYTMMNYRGIENLFGFGATIVSDILIDNTTRTPYICNDNTKFATSITGDYTACSYNISNTSGFISAIGYDENNLSVQLPTEVAGSTSTYFTDMMTAPDSTGISYLTLSAPTYSSSTGIFHTRARLVEEVGTGVLYGTICRLSTTGKCGQL